MRTLRLIATVQCLALSLALASHSQTAFAQEKPGQNQAAVRIFNATAALQNSGFHERAATKWQDFLTKYPTDERIDRVTYYLGVCQLHLKKYAEASATFQSVLTKFPKFKNRDGAQYNLAMAHYQQAILSQTPADYAKAAKSFSDTVTQYATSQHAAKACYFQGESLLAAGDRPAAAVAYGKLIQSYGKSTLVADAYYALGTTQQEIGDNAAAAATFAKFLADANLQKHALASEIRLRLGMSLYSLEKYSEAEAQFKPLIQLANFDYADFATLRYGQCRMEAADAAGAVVIFADLEKRFSASPYKSAAQLAAGRCLFQLEKFAEAAQKLQPLAAANRSESIEAAYYLGRALVKNNQAPQAVAALNPVIQSIKQGPLAKLVADEAAATFVPYVEVARIDALYEIPERRKETIALYDEFFKLHPKHALAAQSLYMSALVSLKEGDNSGARQRAELFLGNADPMFAQSDLAAAVLFIAAEGYLLDETAADAVVNRGKAEQFYRQLVTKFPQHNRVPRANLRIGWCVYQAEKYDDTIKHLTGVLGTLKEPDQTAAAQLLIGHSHREMQRDKEAIAAYDAALTAAPNWERTDEVLLGAAQSFTALDDSANATSRLEQLIAKAPESSYRAQALYQLGELAQAAKGYDKAIARYNEVLQKDAASAFAVLAQYGIGSANFAKEDYPQAVVALNKIIDGKPDEAMAKRTRYLRGLAFQRLKQFDTAILDLQYYLAAKPGGDTAFDAQYYLAICQIGLKQFEPASQTLTALLVAKADYEHADKAFYELGHAYLSQGDGTKARDAFDRLLKARPESPLAAESCFQIGHIHEQIADATEDAAAKLAEIGKADSAFRQGIAKSKADALREKLQYKLGDMLFRQENYAEASQTLIAQITAFPAGELAGPGRFLAAECLFQQDQFQQALPHFQQVANEKVEKYHDQALYRAGTCAKNLSSWPVSQQNFDALIKQFPKFEQISEARFGLALALENQQQHDAAITLYEQVTEETETEAAARSRFRVAGIAFARKKYDEAIEHFLLVAVGYPYEELQVDAHYEAGQCMAALGQKEKAIAQFEMVIKKAPDKPRAKEAATRIADLKKP